MPLQVSLLRTLGSLSWYGNIPRARAQLRRAEKCRPMKPMKEIQSRLKLPPLPLLSYDQIHELYHLPSMLSSCISEPLYRPSTFYLFLVLLVLRPSCAFRTQTAPATSHETGSRPLFQTQSQNLPNLNDLLDFLPPESIPAHLHNARRETDHISLIFEVQNSRTPPELIY